jgi:DNA invertase Pin-like site-specific DNA recombinase
MRSRVSLYRLAKNSMSRSFASFGRSCWIQCPAPGTRTFFLKPGIVSSKLSKACRYMVITASNSSVERAKCRKIYEEHASGKNTTRPELEACLKSLRTGDTLVVWRLDRLGRSLGNLIQLTNELQSRHIDLESLTEKLDTGSPTGKLLSHVFAALAEFERNLISRADPCWA